MHKISVDVAFTQIKSKKGLKRHNKRAIESRYKDYTHIKDMKVLRALNPNSLKNSQIREHRKQ